MLVLDVTWLDWPLISKQMFLYTSTMFVHHVEKTYAVIYAHNSIIDIKTLKHDEHVELKYSLHIMFSRFRDAEDALNQTNSVAAGTPTDELAPGTQEMSGCAGPFVIADEESWQYRFFRYTRRPLTNWTFLQPEVNFLEMNLPKKKKTYQLLGPESRFKSG